MTLQDEINVLVKQKQELMRDYDAGSIDEPTYHSRMTEVNDNLDVKNKLRIQELNEEKQIGIVNANKKSEEEKKKMTDETVEVEKPKKIGRKVRENSYASVIGTVLQKKSIKNIDASVEKVLELKPGKEPAKVKSLMTTIIREAKKGKGRWAIYDWDAENFLLVPKEE